MITLFKHKTPPLLGLDISSSSIKLLELSYSHNQYRVESFAVASLPTNTIVEKNIQDSTVLAQTISRIITESRTKATKVAIAVPDSSTITKVLQVDAELNEFDIENHIAFEADKYIPYTLEEVNIDFDILGPSSDNSELLDVLMVSCRSDSIKSYTDTLEEGGLTPQIVDVESYALERAFGLIKGQLPKQTAKQEITGIIDIGHALTTLTVLNNGSTIFSRETGFGGQQLLEQIQERYKLAPKQALEKLHSNSLPDDYQDTILQPFKESLLLHVRRALQFFFSSSQHDEIHHLVLAGGTANIPGLATLLSNQLGTETFLANPFEHMTFAKRININVLKQYASSLVLCCGLAMRNLDGR